LLFLAKEGVGNDAMDCHKGDKDDDNIDFYKRGGITAVDLFAVAHRIFENEFLLVNGQELG